MWQLVVLKIVYLQSEFWAPLESFETEDTVTVEDEFHVLDKEWDITTLNSNLNDANKAVDNIPLQAATIEQTLDVREESIFTWFGEPAP